PRTDAPPTGSRRDRDGSPASRFIPMYGKAADVVRQGFVEHELGEVYRTRDTRARRSYRHLPRSAPCSTRWRGGENRGNSPSEPPADRPSIAGGLEDVARPNRRVHVSVWHGGRQLRERTVPSAV